MLRTKQTVDKLASVAPYAADLIDKAKTKKEIKNLVKNFNLTGAKTADKLTALLRVLPILLKEAGMETYHIIAELADKTVKDVEEQPFIDTVNDIKAIINNEDVKSFFSLFLSNAAGKKAQDE